jgi:hypothetical protein
VQVLCLRRQLQLLLQRRAELSDAAAAAAAALESLVQQQQQALHDVEVQLRLKQGQVRMAGGMASLSTSFLAIGMALPTGAGRWAPRIRHTRRRQWLARMPQAVRHKKLHHVVLQTSCPGIAW